MRLRTALTELLGIEHPIIQAPMAGVSTPEMAATVSNAGALGSIGVGLLAPRAIRDAIRFLFQYLPIDRGHRAGTRDWPGTRDWRPWGAEVGSWLARRPAHSAWPDPAPSTAFLVLCSTNMLVFLGPKGFWTHRIKD
jgi:hypothetical protein